MHWRCQKRFLTEHPFNLIVRGEFHSYLSQSRRGKLHVEQSAKLTVIKTQDDSAKYVASKVIETAALPQAKEDELMSQESNASVSVPDLAEEPSKFIVPSAMILDKQPMHGHSINDHIDVHIEITVK